MTSLDQLIQQRRSIRKYLPEKPSGEQVRQMLACAAMSPSPSNRQPVRWIRVQSETCRQAFREALETGYQRMKKRIEETGGGRRLQNRVNAYHRYSSFLFSAPVIMAVGVDSGYIGFSKLMAQSGIQESDKRKNTDLDISVGLAVSLYILKGEALGIKSCILSAPLVFIDQIETVLGLTDLSIRCLVTSGYPDETPSHIERKKIESLYREI